MAKSLLQFIFIISIASLVQSQLQYPANQDQTQQGGNNPQYNNPPGQGSMFPQYNTNYNPSGPGSNYPQYNTNYNPSGQQPGGNYQPSNQNYNPSGQQQQGGNYPNTNPNNAYGDLGNPDKYNVNPSNPNNQYGDLGNPDKYNNYNGYNPGNNAGNFDAGQLESPYGDFGIRHPIENAPFNWYPNNDDGIPYADGLPYPYQYPTYQGSSGYARGRKK